MIYEKFDLTRFSPGGGPGAQGAKMRFGQNMGMPNIKRSSGRGDSHATIFRSLRLKMRPPKPKTCKNRSKTVLFGTIWDNFHRVWACCKSNWPYGGGLSYAPTLRSLQPKLRSSEKKNRQSRSKTAQKWLYSEIWVKSSFWGHHWNPKGPFWVFFQSLYQFD